MGCGISTDDVSIEIQGAEIGGIEADQTELTIFAGDVANLNVSGAQAYEWSPVESLSCSDCPNPVANPTFTTTYTVMDVTGCLDETTVTVIVKDNKLLLLPTAFSPNEDGVNDEFRVLDRGLEYFTLRIYARWGN